MSPILVRPVREQLEHDRVIRLLQAKYKRKFEAVINPGHEQNASVLVGGTSPWFPDLVLFTMDKARKLAGTVEVETAESVNNLEAMSQWKTFAQQKAPFHLYVPASSIDTAKRMAVEMEIPVAEIWAYSPLGDQIRFTMVHRSAAAEAKARAAAAAEAKARPEAPVKPVAPAKPAAAAKPAAPVARAAAPNGRSRTARPAAAAPAARPAATRRAAPAAAAAKARRKPAAAARGAAKAPAARRATAKKPAARVQKRK